MCVWYSVGVVSVSVLVIVWSRLGLGFGVCSCLSEGLMVSIVAALCSRIGFSLARTSFFRKFCDVLKAMVGGVGKIALKNGSFWIGFQCLYNICFILCVSSQNCVMKTVLFCLGLVVLVRDVCLDEKRISLISCSISICLYPLVMSFLVRWCFILLNVKVSGGWGLLAPERP